MMMQIALISQNPVLCDPYCACPSRPCSYSSVAWGPWTPYPCQMEYPLCPFYFVLRALRDLSVICSLVIPSTATRCSSRPETLERAI